MSTYTNKYGVRLNNRSYEKDWFLADRRPVWLQKERRNCGTVLIEVGFGGGVVTIDQTLSGILFLIMSHIFKRDIYRFDQHLKKQQRMRPVCAPTLLGRHRGEYKNEKHTIPGEPTKL